MARTRGGARWRRRRCSVFGFAGAGSGARWGGRGVGRGASRAPPGCGVFGGFGASSVGDRVTDRVVDREDGMDERAADGGGRRRSRRAVFDRRVAGSRRRSRGHRVRRPLRRGNLFAPLSRAGRVRRWEGPRREVSIIRRVSAVGDGGFIVSASVPVGSNGQADVPAVTCSTRAGVPSGPVPLRADERDRDGR